MQVPVSGRLRGNNMEMLYELALSDSGIGLLPDWLVDADIQAGRLTVLCDDWMDTAPYQPKQRASRRVSAFLDFLAQLPDRPIKHGRAEKGIDTMVSSRRFAAPTVATGLGTRHDR